MHYLNFKSIRYLERLKDRVYQLQSQRKKIQIFGSPLVKRHLWTGSYQLSVGLNPTKPPPFISHCSDHCQLQFLAPQPSQAAAQPSQNNQPTNHSGQWNPRGAALPLPCPTCPWGQLGKLVHGTSRGGNPEGKGCSQQLLLSATAAAHQSTRFSKVNS